MNLPPKIMASQAPKEAFILWIIPIGMHEVCQRGLPQGEVNMSILNSKSTGFNTKSSYNKITAACTFLTIYDSIIIHA